MSFYYNRLDQITIFNVNTKKHPTLFQIYTSWDFSEGLKNEFEIAAVNKPRVFEPPKFYCVSGLALALTHLTHL